MCIIIIKDNDKILDDKVLLTSSVVNPDGLGVLWLDTYEVEKVESSHYHILKTPRPFVAHFRYATVGKINLNNCHPFSIDKNNLLFQNGTIRNLGNKIMTDTEHMAQILGRCSRRDWRDVLEQSDCRFVVGDKKKKKYYIYNKQDWFDRDGVLYSKRNVLDMELVAVYGTLKYGGSNYYSYLRGSNMINSGITFNKYPLIIDGLPYLLSKKGKGHNVEVDVFAVDKETLEDIDTLEGHPKWYKREKTPIILDDGNVVSCWTYFNDTINHKGKKYHKSFEIVKKSYNVWDNWNYTNDYITHSYDNGYLKEDEVEQKNTFWGADKVDECCSKCDTRLYYDDYDRQYYCMNCEDYEEYPVTKD